MIRYSGVLHNDMTISQTHTVFEHRVEKNGIVSVDLGLFFLALFVFLCLFNPIAFQSLKLAVGILAILFSLPSLRFRREPLVVILLFCLMTVPALFISMMDGISFSTASFLLSFVYPFFYLALFSRLSSAQDLGKIAWAVLLAALSISVYDLLFCGASILKLELLLDFLQQFELNAGFGFAGLMTEYTTSHMVSLLFTFPFLAIYAFCDNGKSSYSFLPRGLVVSVFVLQCICVLLSGRKAIWIAAALCLVLALVIRRKHYGGDLYSKDEPTIVRLSAIVLSSLVLVFIIAQPSFWVYVGDLFASLSDAFSFDDPTKGSAYVRGQQSVALINGWLESPLFGNGFGAYAADYIRDPNNFAAYELTYLALLLQKGLFGFALYFGICIWSLVRCYKIGCMKNEFSLFALSAAMGLLGMLIGDATNPYMGRFACMWIFFLPSFVVSLQEETETIRKFGASHDSGKSLFQVSTRMQKQASYNIITIPDMDAGKPN